MNRLKCRLCKSEFYIKLDKSNTWNGFKEYPYNKGFYTVCPYCQTTIYLRKETGKKIFSP